MTTIAVAFVVAAGLVSYIVMLLLPDDIDDCFGDDQ